MSERGRDGGREGERKMRKEGRRGGRGIQLPHTPHQQLTTPDSVLVFKLSLTFGKSAESEGERSIKWGSKG